jgi:hypothetical protein
MKLWAGKPPSTSPRPSRCREIRREIEPHAVVIRPHRIKRVESKKSAGQQGGARMTPYQDKAVWELCRQGFHSIAAEAERAWARGEGFEPATQFPLAPTIMEFIRIANWETTAAAAA